MPTPQIVGRVHRDPSHAACASLSWQVDKKTQSSTRCCTYLKPTIALRRCCRASLPPHGLLTLFSLFVSLFDDRSSTIYVRCISNDLLVLAACPNLAKVTERKHRLVKSAALFVFRSLEHTTLAHILNDQCEQVIEGHSLFQKRFFISSFSPRYSRHPMH